MISDTISKQVKKIKQNTFHFQKIEKKSIIKIEWKKKKIFANSNPSIFQKTKKKQTKNSLLVQRKFTLAKRHPKFALNKSTWEKTKQQILHYSINWKKINQNQVVMKIKVEKFNKNEGKWELGLIIEIFILIELTR